MARKQNPITVEFLLLGIIRNQPIHAYDLDKLLNEHEELNIVWKFNQSQLYAILDKLEKNNLIQSEMAQGDAFPFRKVYTLTELGEKLFQQWKISPVEKPRTLRSDFLVKLYFLKDEPTAVFETVIHEQIKVCEEWIDSLVKKQKERPEDSVYIQMVLQFRIENLKAAISWLEECLEIRRNNEIKPS